MSEEALSSQPSVISREKFYRHLFDNQVLDEAEARVDAVLTTLWQSMAFSDRLVEIDELVLAWFVEFNTFVAVNSADTANLDELRKDVRALEESEKERCAAVVQVLQRALDEIRLINAGHTFPEEGAA